MKHPLLTSEAIKALSPLEADIVRAMQPAGKYSAAEIYTNISSRQKVAHSSISVLLDRLYKRGVVSRETKTARGGIRFIYSLETNKERYEKSVVDNTVNLLIKRFGAKAIAYFNESLKTKR